MTITIHRGTHQIGGCVTEIKTDNARILIDIGDELPGTEHLTELYIDGVTTGEQNCNGVFITHYHGDHVGLYTKVLPQIPIYMGEVAKEIYFALMTRIKADGLERINSFKTFKALDKIVIKDITVTPLLVDHSAFDAYMFLVESGGKRILHTGDFRLHGFRGKAVLPTIKKYVGKVDVLITEGTALSRENKPLLSEAELKVKARMMLRDNKYVFVLCSSTNIDRIAAFYNALPRGKYFVCDEYQKSILAIVTKHAGHKTSLYNFEKVHTYGENLYEKLRDSGFCMFVRSSDYFMRIMDKFPDAEFLYSMWEGYGNGNNRNEAISLFVSKYNFKPFHTSGHALPTDIRRVIDELEPKKIIPIHTLQPTTLLDYSDKVEIKNDGEKFIVS